MPTINSVFDGDVEVDPNANLKEQRQIVKNILKTWDDCNADGSLTQGQRDYVAGEAQRLAELVQALDQWITDRGALPRAWDSAYLPEPRSFAR